MSSIERVYPLENPQFIKPIAIDYRLKGIQRRWEAIISHDSVSILLYHKEKNAFIVVKQLRVPVLNANKKNGMMYELCAGIVDKKMPLVQIAQEEVFEECGYKVPLESIERVSSFYTSVGISGALQTLFFAQIDESMHLSDGGGLIEEDIEVITIPLEEAKTFMFDETYQKTPGLMMAFYWFFEQKRVQTQD